MWRAEPFKDAHVLSHPFHSIYFMHILLRSPAARLRLHGGLIGEVEGHGDTTAALLQQPAVDAHCVSSLLLVKGELSPRAQKNPQTSDFIESRWTRLIQGPLLLLCRSYAVSAL